MDVNYNLFEKLSLNMPEGTAYLCATDHTFRMLSFYSGIFDAETQKEYMDRGICGYLWGKTCIGAPGDNHFLFSYLDIDKKTLRTITFTTSNDAKVEDPA